MSTVQGMPGRVTKDASGTGPGLVFANGSPYSQSQPHRGTLAADNGYPDYHHAERDELEIYEASSHPAAGHQHLLLSGPRVRSLQDTADDFQN